MKKILMLGFVILLFAGCQNSVNSVENADKIGITSYAKDKRIVTDSFLAKRLQIVGINQVVNENGLMEAQVTALNCQTGWLNTTERYPVNYRFRWLDTYGRVYTDSTPTWRHQIINAGERVYFTSVAPTAEYCDFVLEIKESDEI